MRVIIAGSRTITDHRVLERAIANAGFNITEVVSGEARGVDRMGELWAEEHGVHVTRFPANWSLHGTKAGPIRNQQMADYAEALIAVWDGKSRGTWDMIERARRFGMKMHVEYLRQDSTPGLFEGQEKSA